MAHHTTLITAQTADVWSSPLFTGSASTVAWSCQAWGHPLSLTGMDLGPSLSPTDKPSASKSYAS